MFQGPPARTVGCCDPGFIHTYTGLLKDSWPNLKLCHVTKRITERIDSSKHVFYMLLIREKCIEPCTLFAGKVQRLCSRSYTCSPLCKAPNWTAGVVIPLFFMYSALLIFLLSSFLRVHQYNRNCSRYLHIINV